MNCKTVNINLDTNPYNVYVGANLLDDIGNLDELKDINRVCIICDSNIEKLYLDQVERSIRTSGISCSHVIFEAGEASKNLSTLSYILEEVSHLDMTRSDVFIGLGGGVTTDIAGLVASLWMRGCKVIQIPTSLLAMVDASCGGKTAVDLAAGKNLVGTFWQPECVVCDVNCLNTLDTNLFKDSVAEIIKHACIADNTMFNNLLEKPVTLETYTTQELIDLIAHNVDIKRKYVVADTKESNIRKTLNFGHTLGHAIEASSNFNLGHGTSVAIGMCMISKAATKLGITSQKFTSDLEKIVLAHNLPITCDIDCATILNYVMKDKKKHSDKISCVFVETPEHTLIKDLNKDQLEELIYLAKQ